jgi:hypothetical protein
MPVSPRRNISLSSAEKRATISLGLKALGVVFLQALRDQHKAAS